MFHKKYKVSVHISGWKPQLFSFVYYKIKDNTDDVEEEPR